MDQENSISATQELINRMLSYDGNFDGYPSMTCDDEGLIQAAVKENNQPTDLYNPSDSVILMSFLASEHCTTRAQYDNAKRFILDAVATAWEANMCEGSNPVHKQIEEEQYRDTAEQYERAIPDDVQ